jgi:hypothetical protein
VSKVIAYLPQMFKALTAAATAATAAYGQALKDGVTGGEWVVILCAAVGAGLIAWAVPNKTAAAG